MLTRYILITTAALVMLLMFVRFQSSQTSEKYQLVPLPKNKVIQDESNRQLAEIGTGIGHGDNASTATEQAIQQALAETGNARPDFAILFATSGTDLSEALNITRKMLGEEVQLYGGTSDPRGLMTEKGFFHGEKQSFFLEKMDQISAVSIMTISSKNIKFGSAAASYKDYPSPKEAAKSALKQAIARSGHSPDVQPDVVLITPTWGDEEDVLLGMEEIIGSEVPILGGTTGGPVHGVIGNHDSYTSGISLAVLYTDLPVGVHFDGGFDVESRFSGVITKIDGRAILEINHQPALDVYNTWLDGKVDLLIAQHGIGTEVQDILTVHPLYRVIARNDGVEYRLFSHPWPRTQSVEDRALLTSTNLEKGDTVHMSYGTWSTLLLQIGDTVKKAKINASTQSGIEPLFAIGTVCSGVMGVIPYSEREKMSPIVNNNNRHVPFISNFTWGEQGHYPGIGSKHGNLQTGFVVIGKPKS